MAAYTRCLRCAGAPRRPASGSGLSLLIPSWHAVLSDPGESEHRYVPELRCRHWPSPIDHRLGTPNIPAIRSTRAFAFRGFTGSLPLRPARLLAPLYGSDWDAPALGDFYFQAFNGSVSLPVAGYNYNSDWTPCMGLFLSRSFNQHGLSFFLRFFVVLRPDPPQWQAVARRSCQGWSPLRRPPAALGLRARRHHRMQSGYQQDDD